MHEFSRETNFQSIRRGERDIKKSNRSFDGRTLPFYSGSRLSCLYWVRQKYEGGGTRNICRDYFRSGPRDYAGRQPVTTAFSLHSLIGNQVDSVQRHFLELHPTTHVFCPVHLEMPTGMGRPEDRRSIFRGSSFRALRRVSRRGKKRIKTKYFPSIYTDVLEREEIVLEKKVIII